MLYFCRLALKNFAKMVKPGGILLIDHRNYDSILDKGRAPTRNIYYNVRYDGTSLELDGSTG